MAIQKINPSRCKMWDLHDRLGDDINATSCSLLIQSMRTHGQKHPVLGRRIPSVDGRDVELIYGARRLFAAQLLGCELLVDVHEVDNQSALIEMDIENRVRKDISPYERGMSYKRWLRAGFFKNQAELAKCLGVSQAQVSRLLTYSDLPAVVVGIFPSVRDIREEWAVSLAKRCRDPKLRETVTRRARARAEQPIKDTAQAIYDALSRDVPAKVVRADSHDRVIKGVDGICLFRIAFRAKSVHLVVPRECVTEETLEEISVHVAKVLESKENTRAKASIKAVVRERIRSSSPLRVPAPLNMASRRATTGTSA